MIELIVRLARSQFSRGCDIQPFLKVGFAHTKQSSITVISVIFLICFNIDLVIFMTVVKTCLAFKCMARYPVANSVMNELSLILTPT